MSGNGAAVSKAANKNYLMKKEWIFYMLAIFFYSSMLGMVNSYRRAYLVDVLLLPKEHISAFNIIIGIGGFLLNFLCALVIDNKKIKNGQKFKPIGLAAAIPCGITTLLIFFTPGFVQENSAVLLVWLCVISLIQAASFHFGGTLNMVAAVMTPNDKEREQLLSFRGISSAIGNSAPLVIVLVMGLIIKAVKGEDDPALNYFLSAALCGIIGIVTMLLGMGVIKERTVYKEEEKKNIFAGFADVIKNPHARVIVASELLKNFRAIAQYMEPFIAAAMLGSSSKVVIFALPVGIGTMVGMLVISRLIKKFSARTLYIASGIYSIIANALAFGVGYITLTTEAPAWITIAFVVCLFLTGIQFGASNLLPEMFKADVLDDLEVKTGKRLDACLGFIVLFGGVISRTIGEGVAPTLLIGGMGYQQGITDGTMQSVETKVALLFFYTVFHGIMMLLAGLPFFFYKLTGKEKDRVHEAVLEQRAALAEKQD